MTEYHQEIEVIKDNQYY